MEGDWRGLNYSIIPVFVLRLRKTMKQSSLGYSVSRSEIWTQNLHNNSQIRGTTRTLLHLLLFVLFGCYLCCSMYCLCVNVSCHRATTQLQLINISYHISYHINKKWPSHLTSLHIFYRLGPYPQDIQYYTIVYYTILYCTILYCAMPCYAMLYYTILYCTVLYYTVLFYTIPYYTILYYTILYTVLYYTILFYTILHHTILYYTIILLLLLLLLYYTMLLLLLLLLLLLYYTILYYTILYYTILYYTILYYIILYYAILHYTILHYTILPTSKTHFQTYIQMFVVPIWGVL